MNPSPSPTPRLEIEQCHLAHARLLATVSVLSSREVREASLLPGWTRAHVLSHLAHQGDSVVRRLKAAAEGRLVDQYEGGAATRNREIDEGAGRSADQLLDDVRRSAADVDAVFREYPDDAWGRPVHALDGPDCPASALVFLRWQEVDVHHVDLALGYGFKDLPDALVTRFLADAIAGLGARADPNELLGWLLGRRPAPPLSSWD